MAQNMFSSKKFGLNSPPIFGQKPKKLPLVNNQTFYVFFNPSNIATILYSCLRVTSLFHFSIAINIRQCPVLVVLFNTIAVEDGLGTVGIENNMGAHLYYLNFKTFLLILWHFVAKHQKLWGSQFDNPPPRIC